MNLNTLIRISMLALAFSMAGCATQGDPRDPLEPLNRGIYKFNDVVDESVMKPVAKGYRAVLPTPVRTSVGNFFGNIDDALIMVNNLLQFKLNKAASDFARIVFNTTFGIGGLFDVATGFGLEKNNEDFGQTLGYWGVGDGPFLMLPFLGPSNLRDTVGLAAYYQLDPVWNLDNVATRNSLGALRIIDTRARLLDAEKILDAAALDPYTFLRDAYIQQRRNLIYDGNPPREKLFDDEPAPVKKSAAEVIQPQVVADPAQAGNNAKSAEAAAPAAPEVNAQAEASSGLVQFLGNLFRVDGTAGWQE